MANLGNTAVQRDLRTLPKAHLHLHFTGSLTVAALADLASERQVRLPRQLLDNQAFTGDINARGWFRFQRLYNVARAVVRDEAAMRRVIRQAAIEDAKDGSVRMELQVDPTSYAPFVGGLTPALEIVLDEAAAAEVDTGVSIGIIVAASRIKHPLDARTLARLAARYAGRVVGFGLSNDERVGDTAAFAPAFRIAAEAGLGSVPHGGELLGAQHVQQIDRELSPRRIGHGVRALEDPRVFADLVENNVAFEVCPASNLCLGVFHQAEEVPLRKMFNSGAQIALSADDPLLFNERLNAQYEFARAQGFSDSELAELAKSSIHASFATADLKSKWLAEVDAWLN